MTAAHDNALKSKPLFHLPHDFPICCEPWGAIARRCKSTFLSSWFHCLSNVSKFIMPHSLSSFQFNINLQSQGESQCIWCCCLLPVSGEFSRDLCWIICNGVGLCSCHRFNILCWNSAPMEDQVLQERKPRRYLLLCIEQDLSIKILVLKNQNFGHTRDVEWMENYVRLSFPSGVIQKEMPPCEVHKLSQPTCRAHELWGFECLTWQHCFS